MPEEIFIGHDCSKEAKFSTRTEKETGKVTEIHYPLKLQQNKFSVKPGELILLKLLHVHTLCDDACYRWVQVRGGGRLGETRGPEVGFRAPDENDECENSAVINVYMQNKRLDTAYITVNLYKEQVRSYIRELPYRSVGSLDKILYLSFHTANYDCAGNLLSVQTRARGRYRAHGTWIVEELMKIYKERIGKVWDVRTKEMKEGACCPVDILEAEHHESLISV